MPHAAAVAATNEHFDQFQERVNTSPESLSQAINALQDRNQSLLQLAQNRGVSQEMTQHFNDHWLSANWPSDGSVEETLRAGLLNALQTSQQTGLPLQTVIVPNAQAFAVSVVPTAHQVTMVISLPSAPGPNAS
jgi:hypothetical protein